MILYYEKFCINNKKSNWVKINRGDCRAFSRSFVLHTRYLLQFVNTQVYSNISFPFIETPIKMFKRIKCLIYFLLSKVKYTENIKLNILKTDTPAPPFINVRY